VNLINNNEIRYINLSNNFLNDIDLKYNKLFDYYISDY